jgi:photosystem II stability/assembly factor-like uncharacterized protein
MRALIRCVALLAIPAMTRAQWLPQQSNTTAEFRGLVAVSPMVVWASGTRGRVARTTDAGATWKLDTIPGADTLDLRSIAPRSATTAVAMVAGEAEKGAAKIYRMTDGVHWTEPFDTHEKGAFLDAIAFWDDQHGIALGDPIDGKLFILTTDNGGSSWTRVATANSPTVLPGEASFAASGTCLAVFGTSNAWIGTGGGARARVFRSTDRGRTWSVGDTPIHAGNTSSGIFSVAFTDARHGVVVGGDYTQAKGIFPNVALSDDGGLTWALARGPLPAGFMSAVAYLPGTDGRSVVAVGLGGTARSTDGGNSWAMIDSVPYNSVTFASKDAGWAAGPRGRIAKWAPSVQPGGKP